MISSPVTLNMQLICKQLQREHLLSSHHLEMKQHTTEVNNLFQILNEVRGAGCGERGAGCGERGAGCGERGVGCAVRGARCAAPHLKHAFEWDTRQVSSDR